MHPRHKATLTPDAFGRPCTTGEVEYRAANLSSRALSVGRSDAHAPDRSSHHECHQITRSP